MKAKRQPAPVEPGWTVHETALFLATSPKQVYELVEQGLIPHRRLGKKVLFRWVDLEAWLAGLPGVSVQQALADCRRFKDRRSDEEGR